MNVAIRRPPRQMTVKEFLEWCPDDGRKWQLIDGEPRAMAPSKRQHGTMQAKWAALLRNHLLDACSPYSVVTEPGVIPRISARRNFRIPDLVVTCVAEAEDEDAASEPVLVVEILSVGNMRETAANVWAYTTMPSVQEILVLRTVRVGADVLRRRPDGSWPDGLLALDDGDLVLDSIGFAAPLIALYRTTRLGR